MINETIIHRSWYKIFNLTVFFSFLLLLKNIFFDILQIQNFQTYNITDFLINYQGGFVRRGLIGEIVFQIVSIYDVDPRIFFIILVLISLIFLLLVIFRYINKLRLCYWILPLNICLAGAYPMRKDYICMAIVVMFLYSFSTMKNKLTRNLICQLLICIGILIHECMFFMIVPFFVLLQWNDLNKKTSVFVKILSILPVFVIFLLVCIFKGNEQVALDIHNSWNIEEMGPKPVSTIDSLTWSTIDTIKMHIVGNFFTNSCCIYGFFSKPMLWLLTFIIVPNILFIKYSQESKLNSEFIRKFTYILSFQFLSLLPMLTVISCDQSRIFFYWTITSILIFFYIPSSCLIRILPCLFIRVSDFIHCLIFKPCNIRLSCILLMVVAVSPVKTSVPGAMNKSILGIYYRFYDDEIKRSGIKK